MDAPPLSERLQRVAGRHTLSLTHYGRKSGKPFQVTIWFVADGPKVLVATENAERNWVKNVRKTPRVILRIGAETFEGNARYLDDPAERDRVLAKIRQKYRIFLPFMLLGDLLSTWGLRQNHHGAFEVTLSSTNT